MPISTMKRRKPEEGVRRSVSGAGQPPEDQMEDNGRDADDCRLFVPQGQCADHGFDLCGGLLYG